VDDLYIVRVRSRTGRKTVFCAVVEHVGTRERHHFDATRDFIAFLESRCADSTDEPPRTDDDTRSVGSG
jgi:hypothetical protein